MENKYSRIPLRFIRATVAYPELAFRNEISFMPMR